MAITRYHPPLLPDSHHKHMEMTKGRSGAFVRYRDHEERVRLLKERIAELEAQLE